jgi:hypothetical protein
MSAPLVESKQSSQVVRKPRQFRIRTIFVATTIIAVVYGSLNWFGVLAHMAVWTAFLVCGPILGVIVGIRRLHESDAIVNGVQGGALGGAVGFIAALLLLFPAYSIHSLPTIGLIAILGTQIAFAVGGGFGLMIGIIRSLVIHTRSKDRSSELRHPS